MVRYADPTIYFIHWYHGTFLPSLVFLSVVKEIVGFNFKSWEWISLGSGLNHLEQIKRTLNYSYKIRIYFALQPHQPAVVSIFSDGHPWMIDILSLQILL